eukprot:CAMPEP_0118698174 /NCGR_PEP_ID=MMETSP0800-20121206/15031_1 /TAXON_ID=210618 ORGANISM="Striatella unipunctata, Strain CCMP2910" /NCGR_SAMPLE_ID=MMETSP0800 /ASSEMBLY_ACC=CAM_ASM_000638 /LENGTH=510 /DNA_ID=CAMNT_0006597919 /DNA_START=140 /DNA_END=1671 /DNA_ORIENTATION=-
MIAAAQLSDRYITHRFLPDKAIDLIDEASAARRVQLDSRPEEIDKLERRILQLEIESTALGREKDKESKKRRTFVKDKIANLREELEPLQNKWEADRGRADQLKEVKERLNYEKAADLKYGAIPDLKNHLGKIIKEENERKAAVMADDETMVSEVVNPQSIAEVISRWTGIPVTKLSQTDRERLLSPDVAVEEVVDCILRSKAGLSRPSQPTGSFLFLGPTGVGKTELAKALFSELYDGDERHLVRIDMSEYTEQHSVARLVGAPPGYIGHDEGGQLTEAVRRKPYTVVLFDEIEKAHPRVLTLLLQVLDEGRLTDSKGRTVDFTNTVVIMTSNIGATALLNHEVEGARDAVMRQVRSHFSPEFLNRLSAIVMFKSLGVEQLEKICQKAMVGVKRRLATQGIRVSLESSGAKAILDESYEHDYGARPVERYLERTVVTTLSRMLLRGDLPSGSTVHIEASPEAADDKDVVEPSKKKRTLAYRIARTEVPEISHSPVEDEPMDDAEFELIE